MYTLTQIRIFRCIIMSHNGNGVITVTSQPVDSNECIVAQYAVSMEMLNY